MPAAARPNDGWLAGWLAAVQVDYVLVVFGGRIGYSSDDINKFLWMVRISSGEITAFTGARSIPAPRPLLLLLLLLVLLLLLPLSLLDGSRLS